MLTSKGTLLGLVLFVESAGTANAQYPVYGGYGSGITVGGRGWSVGIGSSTPAYATPVYGTPVYGSPVYGTPVYSAPIYSTPAPVVITPNYGYRPMAYGYAPQFSYGYRGGYGYHHHHHHCR